MRNVVLDTNIVIDYLSSGRSSHREAVELLEELIASPELTPTVCAESVKDVYYILRRMYSSESIVRERLAMFCEIIDIAGLSEDTVRASFHSNEPDYEDALVRTTAEKLDALAIVTRDKTAFQASSIPTVDALEFFKRFVNG